MRPRPTIQVAPKISQPSARIVKPVLVKDNRILSYRLRGLAYGVAAAGAYCYWYLHDWSVVLLAAAAVAGYCVGDIVGRFLQADRQK